MYVWVIVDFLLFSFNLSRGVMTLFFGITVFLNLNQNPVPHLSEGGQICDSLTYDTSVILLSCLLGVEESKSD